MVFLSVPMVVSHLYPRISWPSSLKNGRIPALALAIKTFLGPVPNELKDLTITEEVMIARCHPKCRIIKHQKQNQDLELENTARYSCCRIIKHKEQNQDLELENTVRYSCPHHQLSPATRKDS